MPQITPAQWQQYHRDGYLVLGKLVTDEELTALQNRIDEIMLGKARVNYDNMLMQLDSESGKYEDAGIQSRGHKGKTLGYRKIQDLEFDPLFLAYMQKPIFKEICDHEYGHATPIACMRAMFFNKPRNKGTKLPWHQDRWSNYDRDPLVTIWAALDPATRANGCVEIIPGSHRRVINPSHGSGFLTPEQAAEICTPEKTIFLELKPGEAALLHNWTLHSSDVNRSEIPRRAFSTCFMDANTISKSGEKYSIIFGPNALTPESIAPVEV